MAGFSDASRRSKRETETSMKTATTLEAAVAMIPDGATLMIGGFFGVGTPRRLMVMRRCSPSTSAVVRGARPLISNVLARLIRILEPHGDRKEGRVSRGIPDLDGRSVGRRDEIAAGRQGRSPG